MVMEFMSSRMGLNMKDIGEMIRRMVTESFSTRIMMSLKGIGSMIKLQDMGSFSSTPGSYMKDNGLTTNKMERVG